MGRTHSKLPDTIFTPNRYQLYHTSTMASTMNLTSSKLATRTSASTGSRSLAAPRTSRAFASRSASVSVRCEVAPEDAPKSSLIAPMTFSGWAPEIINGRIAQIGFVAGLGAEAASGETFATQFAENPGAFALCVGLIGIASVMPSFMKIYMGKDDQEFNSNPTTKAENLQGMFNVDAEKLNGRAAMIGIVSIVATEFVKGGPLLGG